MLDNGLLKIEGYQSIKLFLIGDLSILESPVEVAWKSCESSSELWLYDGDANDWRRGNQQWAGPSLWFGPIQTPDRLTDEIPFVEFSESLHQQAQEEKKVMAAVIAQNTRRPNRGDIIVTQFRQLLCTPDQIEAIFRGVESAMGERSNRDVDKCIYAFTAQDE